MVPEGRGEGMDMDPAYMHYELYVMGVILNYVLCPKLHFKVYHKGRTC